MLRRLRVGPGLGAVSVRRPRARPCPRRGGDPRPAGPAALPRGAGDKGEAEEPLEEQRGFLGVAPYLIKTVLRRLWIGKANGEVPCPRRCRGSEQGGERRAPGRRRKMQKSKVQNKITRMGSLGGTGGQG